jgi:hypothetical protein
MCTETQIKHAVPTVPVVLLHVCSVILTAMVFAQTCAGVQGVPETAVQCSLGSKLSAILLRDGSVMSSGVVAGGGTCLSD